MGRLPGFDYKRPFFYMVTLKKACGAGLAWPFSAIEGGEVAANGLTRAFEGVIRRLHETWYCIEPIRYFVIMPDHIHLIIKIRDIEKRVSLAVVVRQLIKRLEEAARAGAMAAAEPPLKNQPPQNRGVLQAALRAAVFEFDWHDWIVKKEGQLAAFTRYIRSTPHRRRGRTMRRSIAAAMKWAT